MQKSYCDKTLHFGILVGLLYSLLMDELFVTVINAEDHEYSASDDRDTLPGQ